MLSSEFIFLTLLTVYLGLASFFFFSFFLHRMIDASFNVLKLYLQASRVIVHLYRGHELAPTQVMRS